MAPNGDGGGEGEGGGDGDGQGCMRIEKGGGGGGGLEPKIKTKFNCFTKIVILVKHEVPSGHPRRGPDLWL